ICGMAAEIIKGISASSGTAAPTLPSPLGGGSTSKGITTPTPTPTATPAPTPATVTIPVPVFQQSMVLDCETAALQQGLAYYGINVSQSELFGAEYADTRM